MQGVMCTLNGQFSSMKIKEETVNIAIPATEITDHFENIQFIEPLAETRS